MLRCGIIGRGLTGLMIPPREMREVSTTHAESVLGRHRLSESLVNQLLRSGLIVAIGGIELT